MQLPPEFDGGVLRRSATIESFEDDTFTGRIVPYETETELMPGIFEVFTRGAFKNATKDAARVKVMGIGHSPEVIGHALEVEDREDGVHVRAQIVDTQAGVDALKLLRAGSVDALSIEFRAMPRHQRHVQDRKGLHVRHDKGHLLAVSPVAVGAYNDARVLSVRDAHEAAREAERLWLEAFRTRVAKE